MHRQDGFTLIELLTTMLLASLLFLGGGLALRNYWQVRSLEGAADEVQTQLRRQQERSVAESNPRVFGAGFDLDSANWALVRVDLSPTGNTCVRVESRKFDAGVVVRSASFLGADELVSKCQLVLPGYDDFAFFYARGSATAGTVTVEHPGLGRNRSVKLSGVTGRVDRQ